MININVEFWQNQSITVISLSSEKENYRILKMLYWYILRWLRNIGKVLELLVPISVSACGTSYYKLWHIGVTIQFSQLVVWILWCSTLHFHQDIPMFRIQQCLPLSNILCLKKTGVIGYSVLFLRNLRNRWFMYHQVGHIYFIKISKVQGLYMTNNQNFLTFQDIQF